MTPRRGKQGRGRNPDFPKTAFRSFCYPDKELQNSHMSEQRSVARAAVAVQANVRRRKSLCCGSLGGSNHDTNDTLLAGLCLLVTSLAYGQSMPSPLLAMVSRRLVVRLQVQCESFPACGGTAQRACLFGGTVQKYKNFGQQFAFASTGRHPETRCGCVATPPRSSRRHVQSDLQGQALLCHLERPFTRPYCERVLAGGPFEGCLAWNKTA